MAVHELFFKIVIFHMYPMGEYLFQIRALNMWSKAFARFPTLLVHRVYFRLPKISLLSTETCNAEVRKKDVCDTPEVRKYLSEIVVSRRVPDEVPNVGLLRDVSSELILR